LISLVVFLGAAGGSFSPAAAREVGQNSQVEETRPHVDTLWGLFGDSKSDLVSRIRKEAATGDESARAALLEALEPTLKAGSALPKLELGRALHRVSRGKRDSAVTLALVRLFRAPESADDPLRELTKATLAMALGRSVDLLGRRTLQAELNDSRRTDEERVPVELVQGAFEPGAGLSLEDLLSTSTSTAGDDEPSEATPNPKLLTASLAEARRAFEAGALWLAFRLTAETRRASKGSATAFPRLLGPLAWLEADSLTLRLSTTAGLGRRLQIMTPGLDRDRIRMALEERYRVEPNALVRRALVIAMARGHSGVTTSESTLRLASDLDPDPVVRRIAERALAEGDLFLRKGNSPRTQESGRSADQPNPIKTGQVLKFAVDGTPCFTDVQCRVLPFAANSRAKRDP